MGDRPLSSTNRWLRTRSRVALTAAAVLTTTGLAVAGPAAALPASASVTVTSHFVFTSDSANTSPTRRTWSTARPTSALMTCCS